MLASQLPTKLQMAFAQNASVSYLRTVPVASQIGITPGAASYNDGFPPLNFLDPAAGGVDVSGKDMNGVLNALSAMLVWYSAGGAITYDSTYQTAIGGYPRGSVLQSAITAGFFWISTADANTTNPDTGGAGWIQAYSPPAGTVVSFSGSSVPTGYLAVPTTQTLVSTTTYANLFAAIGYTWGGSGANFGLPYLASGYMPVQGTLAAITHGKVKDHTHKGNFVFSSLAAAGASTFPQLTYTDSATPTAPEGGADNLAAGVGMSFIVKF
jgi:microcystin-dependent protein